MIGIFTADTTGLKRKFTLSFAIKFFTYWYLKDFKLKHPEFKWMKLKDIPTHSVIGFDQGRKGNRIIFESSKTQQLYPYYKCNYEFVFAVGNNVDLFWEVVNESVGKWYGIFQLWYFVKTWFWMTFFPKWFVKLWGKIFHGGKSILLWGNPFVWFQICTEQAYILMRKYEWNYGFVETYRQLARANQNNIFPLLLLDMCLEIESSGEMIMDPNYTTKQRDPETSSG